jgi:hypothetical protein
MHYNAVDLICVTVQRSWARNGPLKIVPFICNGRSGQNTSGFSRKMRNSPRLRGQGASAPMGIWSGAAVALARLGKLGPVACSGFLPESLFWGVLAADSFQFRDGEALIPFPGLAPFPIPGRRPPPGGGNTALTPPLSCGILLGFRTRIPSTFIPSWPTAKYA